MGVTVDFSLGETGNVRGTTVDAEEDIVVMAAAGDEVGDDEDGEEEAVEDVTVLLVAVHDP